MAIIKNIRQLKHAAVLADRTKSTPCIGFLKYNLIYGFNGSGKSTLSRLFLALQNGKRPDRLPKECTFEIEMTDGTVYSCPDSITGIENRVCVFNGDFVDVNLDWHLGTANPVFTISSEQGEAVKKLTSLENALPAEKLKLLAEEKVLAEREKSFASYKRERARTISDRLRQTGRKYEAPQLADDYKKLPFDEKSILGNEHLDAATATCARAEPLPKINSILLPIKSAVEVIITAIDVGPKTLGSVVIEGMDQHPSMVPWLKTGHEYHSAHKLSTCLYCGEEISVKRQDILKTAFDDKVNAFIEGLAKEEKRARLVFDELKLSLASIPVVTQLSSEFRAKYTEAAEQLTTEMNNFSLFLKRAVEVLSARHAAPTNPVEPGLPSLKDVQEVGRNLEIAVTKMNASCTLHNNMVDDFAHHQNEARLSIRKHFLADGADDYNRQISEREAAEAVVINAKESISNIEKDIASLRAEVQKHGPAADRVNNLIKSYLGHGELTIVPVEKGYELHRHGKPVAGAPSEGEKSAIALCYFLSTLEANGRKGNDLIVVIDDPISSLDTKAMNYACALIRGRLKNVAQLFVLTHNQDCMNEFKKPWKSLARKENPEAKLLYIDVTVAEGSAIRKSSIVEMSKLLRDYDSEYHFLFQKVLLFESAEAGYFEYAFIMPNILRRVIEIFLAFKIPRSGNIGDKLEEICKEYNELDVARIEALERLSQVESHSDNLDDLIGHSSMTIEEARDANAALLELMGRVDPSHLAGLRKYCKPKAP